MLLDHSIKSLFEITQIGTRKPRESVFFMVIGIFSALVMAALLFFIVTYLAALFQNTASGHGIIKGTHFFTVIGWTLLGLFISTLSSLLAWPVALATAVVLQQEKSHWANVARNFVAWLSTIPIVVYVYIFIQYMALNLLTVLRVLWLDSLASVNWVTQLIAFTITLLLYPLLLFVPDSEGVTIDQFFNKSLEIVMSFGEIGLTLTIVCLGLSFVILPRMVHEMQNMLKNSNELQSLEVVRSIGGTFWESMHISIIHSMRSGFLQILVRFIRYGFFEGIVVFLLIKYLFVEGGGGTTSLGDTVASYFVRELVDMSLDWRDLLSLGGWLLIIHFCFIKLESFLFKRGRR